MDDINKLLTNIAEYSGQLRKFANDGYDPRSDERLEGFAEVRERHIDELFALISKHSLNLRAIDLR